MVMNKSHLNESFDASEPLQALSNSSADDSLGLEEAFKGAHDGEVHIEGASEVHKDAVSSELAPSKFPSTPLPSITAIQYRGGGQALASSKQKASTLENILRFNWSGVSLRFKATALAIALSTIPLAAVGSFAVYGASKSISEEVKNTQKEQSVQIIDKVNRFMFERYGDIQIIASQPFLTDSTVRATTSTEAQKKILKKFADVYTIYDSIAVYGLDGKLIVEGGSTSAPLDINDREYFQLARKGQVNITNPSASKVTKLISVFTASPIKDIRTGQTIGVVRSRMPIVALEKLIEGFKNGGADDYHVFDAAGKIFLAGDKEPIGKDINQLFPGVEKLTLPGYKCGNKGPT